MPDDCLESFVFVVVGVVVVVFGAVQLAAGIAYRTDSRVIHARPRHVLGCGLFCTLSAAAPENSVRLGGAPIALIPRYHRRVGSLENSASELQLKTAVQTQLKLGALAHFQKVVYDPGY